jgi:hypothetical protein
MGVAIGRTTLVILVLAAAPAWAGVPPPPECSGATGVVVVPVGTPYSVTLTGEGSGTLTVGDNGTLPLGATLTPPSGSSGASPFDVLFAWTPGPADAGNSYPIVVSFEDGFTSSGACEFAITVPALVTTSTTSTTGTTTSTVTTTTLSDCGNGMLDLGEECDPPNGEICNNLVDDDGDLLVDCDDPDCAPLSEESCGADCMLVEPCQPIEKDPATIRFDEGGLDSFWIHGRFALQSAMDPTVEGFGVSLSNSNGLIYRATIAPELLRRTNGRYIFRDAGARRGENVTANGVYTAGVRVRKFRGVDYLVFRLRAYADFSAATQSRMATGIVVGNDIGSLTADWTATRDGWRLSQRDY